MERNIKKGSQMKDSAGFRMRINTLARKCFKMHSGRYGCIEALFPKSNAASISGWISSNPSRTFTAHLLFFTKSKEQKKKEKKP